MGRTAEDVMSEPDFIDISAPVEKVKEEFLGAENTLIVKEDGEAIGEIHENSLLKLLIPEKKIDEEKLIGVLGLSFDKKYVAETAEDLMNRHEVKVPKDESIGDIAFLMEKEDVRSIPVEEDNEVIGVVHENDIIGEI